jgi:hypothetical protein
MKMKIIVLKTHIGLIFGESSFCLRKPKDKKTSKKLAISFGKQPLPFGNTCTLSLFC